MRPPNSQTGDYIKSSLSSQAVFFNYLVIAALARFPMPYFPDSDTSFCSRCQLQLHRLGDLTYRLWSHFHPFVFDKKLQCGRSSLSQNGGADLRAHFSVKFPMILKMGLERSQLFPEIFEIVLRPFWWAAGSEQPSPPLHRAAAARLLRRSCVLQQYFFTPHIICISQCFANHISDGRRV